MWISCLLGQEQREQKSAMRLVGEYDSLVEGVELRTCQPPGAGKKPRTGLNQPNLNLQVQEGLSLPR